MSPHIDWAGPWFTSVPVGRDDHFDAALDVDCADGEEAIEVAKQFVEGFTSSFGRANEWPG